MARELPTVDPRIIWEWGVCDTYRDEKFLRDLTGGKEQVNALEVLALDIRPVDKLWAGTSNGNRSARRCGTACIPTTAGTSAGTSRRR